MPDCTGGLRPHAKRWHGEYSINPAVLIRIGRSPHAIRLLTTKPATGGDVIFAAFKKDADGYSRRHMDFKLLDRV
jgi:hypothetical protein